jgi:hypothetical protein
LRWSKHGVSLPWACRLPHLMRLVHMQPYQERRRRRQAQATSKPPPPVSLSSLSDRQGVGTIHYSSLSMLFLRVSKPRRCCCSRLPSFSIGLKIKICRSLFLWLQRLYLFHYPVIEEAKVLTHLLIVWCGSVYINTEVGHEKNWVRPCLVPKNFQDSLSHRIFRHMYGVLNVDEKN